MHALLCVPLRFSLDLLQIHPMRSRRARRNDCLVIVLGLLSVGPGCLGAYQYRVEGSLQYLPGGAPTPAFTRDFELAVSDRKWRLRTDVPDVQGAGYYEIVYDGRSMFTYTAFDGSATNSNKGVAVIGQGEAPFRNGTFANYVWAGLASASYFQGLTNDQAQAPWLFADGKVRAQWELLGAPPFLPKHVAYFFPSNAAPPPFENGYLAAELRAHSVTNTAGLAIPLEFSYREYRPRRAGAKTAEDVELGFEVRVSVRSLQVGGVDAIGPPAAEGVTLIEDRRLPTPAGAGAIVYPSSSPRLPVVPEHAALEIQKAYQHIAYVQSEASKARPAKRTLVLVLFLFSSVLLFVVLARWRTDSEKQKTCRNSSTLNKS